MIYFFREGKRPNVVFSFGCMYVFMYLVLDKIKDKQLLKLKRFERLVLLHSLRYPPRSMGPPPILDCHYKSRQLDLYR